MLKQLGPTEILIILAVVLLLVGGKKLPELARGSGQALRIFRSEVRDVQDEVRGVRDEVSTSVEPVWDVDEQDPRTPRV